MSKPDSIESKLSALIPSSVSQQGMCRLDETIDRLAHAESVNAADTHSMNHEKDKVLSLRLYQKEKWKVAAIVAILVVCSVSLVTKFNIFESPKAPISQANNSELKQPQQPYVMSSVVSPSESISNDPETEPGQMASREAYESRVQDGLNFLGISAQRPGHELYAQLPKLSPGSGLLLKEVSDGGVAELSGLRKMDVVSRIGDQLIINEEQFLTVLAMHRDEKEIPLTYFRSGRQETISLQMGNLHTMPVDSAFADLNVSNKPKKIVQANDLPTEVDSASISDKSGTATLSYRSGRPWLRIESVKGVETYNGFIANKQHYDLVPSVWRGRVDILKDSLEKSSRLSRDAERARYFHKSKSGFVGSDN